MGQPLFALSVIVAAVLIYQQIRFRWLSRKERWISGALIVLNIAVAIHNFPGQ